MTWEQRWHPLREEWVIISAHRQNRPWVGETVDGRQAEAASYVADCYLCPGNARVSGKKNERYDGVYVFDNDHPCVSADAPRQLDSSSLVMRNSPAQGTARVVCYSPRHNTTLAELNVDQIADLLTKWQAQYLELGERREVNCVLVFENKGDVVGVSNPHPHCQIYATNFVFKTLERECAAVQRYWEAEHRALLADVITAELADGCRVLSEQDSAIAFVPYFARYPYETYVAPANRMPAWPIYP